MRDDASPEWLAVDAAQPSGGLRVGVLGSELIAEWSGIATLICARDGSSWSFTGAPGADPDVVERIREHSAAALIAHARGQLCFHASAVALNGAGLLLIGESCSGKSTTAATLLRGHRVSVLADDACVVDDGPDGSISIVGGNTILRPRAADGTGNRLRVRPPQPPKTSVSAVAFVELNFADGGVPRLKRLGGVEAFDTLRSALFRFVLDDPHVTTRDLDRLAVVAGSVPLYRLVRARGEAALEGSCAALIDLLRARHPA